jgi:hypothetical protein
MTTKTAQLEGYIVGVENPNFSGLATVTIAEKPDARRTGDPGTITRTHVEAGFGVRQLVGFFGSWESLVEEAPTTKLVFTFDDFGMISTFTRAE